MHHSNGEGDPKPRFSTLQRPGLRETWTLRLRKPGSNRRYRVTQPRFREGLMSPLLDSPLTESRHKTRTDTTRTPGALSGTDGSNPAPSTSESAANLTPSLSSRMRRSAAKVVSARNGPTSLSAERHRTSRYLTTTRCSARASEACGSASSDIFTRRMSSATPNRSKRSTRRSNFSPKQARKSARSFCRACRISDHTRSARD